MMDYDAWLENDPNDREWCHEHGYAIPCRVCRMEAAEARNDAQREERPS